MTPRFVIRRWSDRTPRPWKNGGGTTSELVARPQGSNLQSFDWRISVADVASDGPFSTFPGIDRTLVLLEGAVELTVAGRPTVLDDTARCLSFDGGATTSARLLAGPARDLNVMSLRAGFVHRVTRVEPGIVHRPERSWFLFAVSPETAVTIGGQTAVLSRYDLLDEPEGPETLTVSEPCWLIEIWSSGDPS